jgi:hypothetical protein
MTRLVCGLSEAFLKFPHFMPRLKLTVVVGFENLHLVACSVFKLALVVGFFHCFPNHSCRLLSSLAPCAVSLLHFHVQ